MLTLDSEALERHRQQMMIQQETDAMTRYLEDQLRVGYYVDDQGMLRCNMKAQMGKPMSTFDFEQKLGKIARNAVFKPHPTNNTKRVMYYHIGHPEESYIVYENSLTMPEFSVFAPKERKIQRNYVAHPSFRLSSKDLPKYEVIPEERDEAGNITREFEIKFDGLLPGEDMVIDPWNEVIRGWRKVLIDLVLNQVISIADMEQAFGSANRRSYVSYLGKHDSEQAH